MSAVPPSGAQPADRAAGPADVARRRRDPVRTWTIVVALLIALIVIYSMIADRLAPFTNDARVQAFIVRISPEVSGRVTEIAVTENEGVPAGATLFTIDPEPYRIAVAKADAGLAAAGQQVGVSTAAVNTTEAQLAAAKAKRDNLKIESQRIAELVADGVYTQAKGEQAATALAEAEAAVSAAESEVNRARQQLGPEGNSPQVSEALHDLEAAQLDLSRTTVVAPSEGVVTNLQLDAGQYAAAGQPAMTFIDARLVWVVANMRENNLEYLRPGDPAEVVLDSLPGRVFKARVSSIGWGVAGGGYDQRTGLPDVQPASEWLLPAQRFPVRLQFEGDDRPQGARFNSRAAVVVTTGDNPIVNALAGAWIRFLSYATYVY